MVSHQSSSQHHTSPSFDLQNLSMASQSISGQASNQVRLPPAAVEPQERRISSENAQDQVAYSVYEQFLQLSSPDDARSAYNVAAPPSFKTSSKRKPKEKIDLYRSHTCVKGWWLEAVFLLFSILGQIAIAVILFKTDGILLSSWTFYLSPNTVVSTLSTAAKAGMLLAIGECISQLKWLHLGRAASKCVEIAVSRSSQHNLVLYISRL